MKLQQLMSYVRRAIDDFQMIEEGDKIVMRQKEENILNKLKIR